MPTPIWVEVEALNAVIIKAVKDVLSNHPVDPETFHELVTEGKLAAYEALQQYDPARADKVTWVSQSVLHHLQRILKNYLPSKVHSFGELRDETFPSPSDASEASFAIVSPLIIAVLLALAPPAERLYILHELLDWEKPPRYDKARLKQRLGKSEWIRLLTGHVRNPLQRCELLSALCHQAQQGSPREREIAGFALAAIAPHFGEEALPLVTGAIASLLRSDNSSHQLAGLWASLSFHPQAWDDGWIKSLNISLLGAVLVARYAKPETCLCPSPLCTHYHLLPDRVLTLPSEQVIDAVANEFRQVVQALRHQPCWEARWQGRVMAKVLGLYACQLPTKVADLLPSPSHRLAAMLVSIVLARPLACSDPAAALEHALSEWLPKAPTPLERVLRALNSPEPLERSSALYAARGLPHDERLVALLKGLKDPLVFVRFAALRPLEDGSAYLEMERELLSPHEHKRFLHRCLLNTMARADLDRTLEIAKQIYLGQGKEEWRKDSWLRHDAGYILLRGLVDLGQKDLLDVFQHVLGWEAHPSPFVLLPAVQAVQGVEGAW